MRDGVGLRAEGANPPRDCARLSLHLTLRHMHILRVTAHDCYLILLYVIRIYTGLTYSPFTYQADKPITYEYDQRKKKRPPPGAGDFLKDGGTRRTPPATPARELIYCAAPAVHVAPRGRRHNNSLASTWRQVLFPSAMRAADFKRWFDEPEHFASVCNSNNLQYFYFNEFV